MQKLLVLALTGVCGIAAAQTPATNPMPDGSRDMYVGLGLQSAPNYEGGRQRRVRALPVLQVEWSNGAFVSGLMAGMHLSGRPELEYGPLLAINPGRDARDGRFPLGSTSVPGGPTIAPPDMVQIAGAEARPEVRQVHARLEAGGFVNVYLTRQLRVTNSVLYGAGNARKGLRWMLDLQRVAAEVAPHHMVSLSAGVSVVNRSYNNAFFGADLDVVALDDNARYAPSGGVKDVHADLRWNWALAPSWLLTTNVHVSRLRGDAKASPIVERPTSLTVSSALAYRF
ncbi:MAG: MipA/OmpV family protein [Pseudomonadota bacterium]